MAKGSFTDPWLDWCVLDSTGTFLTRLKQRQNLSCDSRQSTLGSDSFEDLHLVLGPNDFLVLTTNGC